MINEMGMVEVKNLSSNARETKYWVCTVVDGVLWFWGAWNDLNEETCQNALNDSVNRIAVLNPAFY